MPVPVVEVHYHSPAQLAERFNLSINTIIRQFEHRPDVIVLDCPETKRKRRYRTFRISETAVQRWLIEHRPKKVAVAA